MKYVYCVHSFVTVEPTLGHCKHNGLMGIHSNKKGAEEHFYGILKDRRRFPGYMTYNTYMAGQHQLKNHKDPKMSEHYCLELIKTICSYTVGVTEYMEDVWIEKRLVSPAKKKD